MYAYVFVVDAIFSAIPLKLYIIHYWSVDDLF